MLIFALRHSTICFPTIFLLIIIFLSTIKWVKGDQDYCNHELYCGPNIPHILCLRGGEMCQPYRRYCKEVLMDFNFRRSILRSHNRLRNEIAMSQRPIGNRYYSVPNMMVFSYSHQLELAARCWSLVCPRRNQICNCSRLRDIPNVAQNVYTGNIYHHSDADGETDQIVNNWYNRSGYIRSSYYAKLIASYAAGSRVEFALNMVNSQSYLIGCARSMYIKTNFYRNTSIVVCNYAPAPVIGRPVFEHRPPACSSCQGDMPCNANFKGLCGITFYPKQGFTLGSSVMYISEERVLNSSSIGPKLGTVLMILVEMWRMMVARKVLYF